MGEIADDMIDGACCSYCGVYFEQDHGFPVLCSTCWKNTTREERVGYQEATNTEL